MVPMSVQIGPNVPNMGHLPLIWYFVPLPKIFSNIIELYYVVHHHRTKKKDSSPGRLELHGQKSIFSEGSVQTAATSGSTPPPGTERRKNREEILSFTSGSR